MVTTPDDAVLRIQSARLDLVPITEADAEEMFEMLLDPHLGAFTGDEPPASVEALRASYAGLASRRSPDGTQLWLNWVMRIKDDGRAVGYLQATVDGDSARLAWVVGLASQRQGYASEGAAAMMECLAGPVGVGDFVAAIHDDHEASKGVARRLSMIPTDELEDGERLWRLSTR